MRSTRTIFLTTILVLATMTTFADAQTGGGPRAAAGEGSPCAANGTAPSPTLAAWRVSCRQNMTQFVRLSLQSFSENRTLILAKMRAAEAHVRADFFDGVAAAVETCRGDASGFGRNASGPHSGAFADCMHAQMAPLRDTARNETKANHTAFAGELKTAKENAKAVWTSDRDAWLSANPKPSS